MTPEAAMCIAGLAYVTDRREMERRIGEAMVAGATDEEADEAQSLWERMRAGDVQQIHSQPTPRCMCSHGKHGGLCGNSACGCGSFRPQPSVRRRINEDLYDPSEAIDRRIS